MPPGAKSFARAKAWFGDEMTSPESGTSTSAVVSGAMTDSFPQELPDAEVTSIAIEDGEQVAGSRKAASTKGSSPTSSSLSRAVVCASGFTHTATTSKLKSASRGTVFQS